jgi:hypothetical protein
MQQDPNEALLSDAGSKKGRMQRLVLSLLLEKERNGEIPTNGRFVFYELEQQGKVRKSRRSESRRERGDDLPREQTVIDALMWLREKGVVPWEWIVDETRTLHGYDRFETIAESLRDSAEYAEINPWGAASPLVLCESRSLSGVLRNLVDEYRCLVAGTNGQVGGFLRTVIAPVLGNGRAVLYLGDLDHQGAQIERNTRRVLEHAGVWTRIALTQEQVDERGIEPMVKEDNRYRPTLVHEAWECEALTQRVVVALVRDALEARLPEPLEDVFEREQQQRDEWKENLHG